MSELMRELPRYKCHKEVWALKIKEVIPHALLDSGTAQHAYLIPEDVGYAPVVVDTEWYRKHSPQAGGYYVVYQDGYKSYSPAEAFESGYTKI